jgi:hypothetical protein
MTLPYNTTVATVQQYRGYRTTLPWLLYNTTIQIQTSNDKRTNTCNKMYKLPQNYKAMPLFQSHTTYICVVVEKEHEVNINFLHFSL